MNDNDVVERETCLICSAPSNGVHFQVNSCRGCAAFFKRTKTLNLEYKCRRGTKNCEIRYDNNQKCRFCRYEKCISVGMTLRGTSKYNESSETSFDYSKVKTDDQTTSNKLATKYQNYTDEDSLSYTPSMYERPESITTNHPQCPYSSPEKLLASLEGNFTLIVQDVKNILNLPLFDVPYSSNISMTCLQRTSLALDNYFLRWDFKHKSQIQILNCVTSIKFLEHKQRSLTFIAELLMHIPEYVQLQFPEKLYIYRHFWPLFSTFDKIISSNMIFGKQESSHLIILNSDTAYEMEKFSFSPDIINKETADEMSNFIKPNHEFFIKYLYTPIQNMELDKNEIAFIVQQLIWSEKKNPGLSVETQKFMEKMVKVVSNELHNYYVYHKKIDNYAWRLGEIMKLIQNASQFSEKIKETFLVAKIFGIFNCSFSECEISGMY
uniref:Nuclear receptor n=1 Tax=Parastrongyloides trichosuri TaxID=131310 RepID=A0A0N4ZDS5_PARTI